MLFSMFAAADVHFDILKIIVSIFGNILSMLSTWFHASSVHACIIYHVAAICYQDALHCMIACQDVMILVSSRGWRAGFVTGAGGAGSRGIAAAFHSTAQLIYH
jgi:hypothetical protein